MLDHFDLRSQHTERLSIGLLSSPPQVSWHLGHRWFSLERNSSVCFLVHGCISAPISLAEFRHLFAIVSQVVSSQLRPSSDVQTSVLSQVMTRLTVVSIHYGR